MLDIISVSCLTGFFGDAALQIATKYLGFNWGLKQYFIYHGSGEALCIASGMMTLFYIFYIYVLRLPLNYTYLAIYGIILDFIFRKTMVFNSLQGYYKALNYFWSAFWGAIPMILPLFIYNIIIKQI
jgi:hypothetical protein